MRSMVRSAVAGVLLVALLVACMAPGAHAYGEIGDHCERDRECKSCYCISKKCVVDQYQARCIADCETCNAFDTINGNPVYRCELSPAKENKPCTTAPGLTGCRFCTLDSTPGDGGAVPNPMKGKCVAGCPTTFDCSVCTDSTGAPVSCDPTNSEGCDMGTCTGICGPTADPELTGFDGVTRWFNELGDFVLLKENGGMEISATFASENPPGFTKAYSWTQTIRVTSPEGEILSCHLPSILLGSDSQQIEVTATDSNGNKFDLERVEGSNSTQTVRFKSMYVKGVVKNGRLVGCQARSERLNIYAIQMFGPEQAARDTTGSHKWAKPFTWINMAFQVPKALKTPVTGLIGRTYPMNKISAARRLTSMFGFTLSADEPTLLAGMTAGHGENFADLLLA